MSNLLVTPERFLSALTCAASADQAEMELKLAPQAASLARHLAREQLSKWMLLDCEEFTERIVLVVSELVTNVIQHDLCRKTAGVGYINMTLFLIPDKVLAVVVADDSPKLPMLRTWPRTDATNGRGLFLVSALSDGWSTTPRSNNGKDVWAFFVCPETVHTPTSA